MGDVIQFKRRYSTGDRLLYAKRFRQANEALRQFVEAEAFFRDQWLKEFEAEFPEFGNREFQASGGLAL